MIVLPTIDVEGVHGHKPFAQLVLGDLGDGAQWGIYRIAEAFQRRGISGTFFVDCYEYTLWGEEPIREACLRLVDMGQDVQLHTHPSWRDDIHDSTWLRRLKRERSYLDQSQDFMAKLTFEEQVQVLQHGVELLTRWIGRGPVAHRSGGYSVNGDTVSALVEVGIPMDSSMNSAHPNSKTVWSTNAIVHRDGLIEIPVTVMSYEFTVHLSGLRRRLYSKKMKTDLDSCSVEDFLAFVQQGSETGLAVLNLFMHSYSLLGFDPFFRHIRPDLEKLCKLEKVLDDLQARNEVQFMNCSELLAHYWQNPAALTGRDGTPRVTANARIAAWGARKLGHALQDACVRGLRAFTPRARARPQPT